MLYLILLIYLVVAYFYPVAGWAALVCMVGPVALSVFRGRYWCGHFCPRGSFYNRIVARFSRQRAVPAVLRSMPFRVFMVCFIFAMFGVQMYHAWGDAGAMGRVFWTIILLTTLVGIVLGLLYAPRTWCMFCPMGTLSAWVAPRRAKKGYKNVHVTSVCTECKRCAKACPMQLNPYKVKGRKQGLTDADCLKCGVCVQQCKKGCISLREESFD